jgi:hypothetical protein
MDAREACMPRLYFRCTCSAYQFVKDYLLQEQPRKSPKAKAIVQNAPISNIVSQPHAIESYRMPSAKGLVPLEVLGSLFQVFKDSLNNFRPARLLEQEREKQ